MFESVIQQIGVQAHSVHWAALVVNSIIALAAVAGAIIAWCVPYRVQRLNAEDAQKLRLEKREAILIVLRRELELLYNAAKNGHFQANRIWERVRPRMKGESVMEDEEHENLFRISMPSVKVLDSPEIWSLLVTGGQARNLTDAYSTVTDFRSAHKGYFDDSGRAIGDKVAWELERKLKRISEAVEEANAVIRAS